ncbi:MAG: glycosyltransferase 87 family protein, partial [Acidobacteriota bacterium]
MRMTFPKPNARTILVLLAGLAFVVKVLLALHTFGSFDVLTWQRDLEAIHLRGVPDLYRNGISYFSPEGRLLITQSFIHPPFIIHALHVWEWLSIGTGLPVQFWIRFTCAVADVASLMLLAGVLRRGGVERVDERLSLVAMCPVSILISGFHGNTDPIMMTFVVASIYLIESRGAAWVGGVSLGMALNIKLAALIFVPAIGLHVPGIRRKLELGGAAAATFLIGSMPYLLQEPRLILSRIGGYKSQFGPWGAARICFAFAQDDTLPGVCNAYRAHGRFIPLLLIIGATI